MDLERYEYLTNKSFLDYEFYSEGPNGKVRKVVSYSLRNTNGISYFNLYLGDWNEETKQVDYKAITNNQDCTKVLATVATTVVEVTSHFPDMAVYAIGSTPSRTRLYQMGILTYWSEIQACLEVYGYRNNSWEPFRKNINYEAFFVKRKQIVNL
jgi:hypothetical protein